MTRDTPNRRTTALCSAVLVGCLAPWGSDAQVRLVPEARGQILSAEQKRERDARIAELATFVEGKQREIESRRAAGLDTAGLEAEVAQAESAYQEVVFGPMRELVPVIAQRWAEIPTRLRLYKRAEGEPLTAGEARQLLDELYVDFGVPEANDRQQVTALHNVQVVLPGRHHGGRATDATARVARVPHRRRGLRVTVACREARGRTRCCGDARRQRSAGFGVRAA